MAKKISLQSFEGKICKNVCFCAEKTRFCRTGEATIYELFLCTKKNQNKHNFLTKSLAPMGNFAKNFSAGFAFNFLLF